MDIDKPILTEPGVKYFLSQTLKQCHIIKNNFHNLLFNISLFVGFLLILGIFLFYKYKGRLTPAEIEYKNQEKQQYILSKINKFQETKKCRGTNTCTRSKNWMYRQSLPNLQLSHIVVLKSAWILSPGRLCLRAKFRMLVWPLVTTVAFF